MMLNNGYHILGWVGQDTSSQPASQEKPASGQVPANSSRRRLLIGGTVLGAVLVGGGAWKFFSSLSKGKTFAYQHAGPVESISWSPDGGYLASASSDRTVQIRDSSTGANVLTYKGHTDGVTGVDWSPDGKSLISTGLDGTVQMWVASNGHILNILSAQQQSTSEISGPIFGGVWSTKAPFIAIAVNTSLNLIDVNHWGNLSGNNEAVVMAPNVLSWSPHDPVLAIADESHSVVTWDVNSKVGGARCIGHSSRVRGVSWSPDGSKVVSGSEDNTARIWSIPLLDASAELSGTSMLVYQGHHDWVQAVAWSPDGSKIASAGRDKTVQVWDASSGQLLFTYHGHSAPVNALAWSPDGAVIASAGDDRSVQIWTPIS